jgi:hypothetical protein
VTTTGGSGFITSGPLDVTITPDRYYLLGVSTTTPHRVREIENSIPTVVSFAQVIGAYTYDSVNAMPNSVDIGGLEITTAGFGVRVGGTSGR